MESVCAASSASRSASAWPPSCSQRPSFLWCVSRQRWSSADRIQADAVMCPGAQLRSRQSSRAATNSRKRVASARAAFDRLDDQLPGAGGGRGDGIVVLDATDQREPRCLRHLDDRGLHAELSGAHRGDVAAGSATDDEYIEFIHLPGESCFPDVER